MKVYNCKCGKMATWCNGAGDYSGYPFFCDDCVPRGCFCNDEYDDPEHNCSIKETTDWFNSQGVKWVWKENCKSISKVDDQGRFLPCIEYSHQESGFETIEEENESFSKQGTEFSERQALHNIKRQSKNFSLLERRITVWNQKKKTNISTIWTCYGTN